MLLWIGSKGHFLKTIMSAYINLVLRQLVCPQISSTAENASGHRSPQGRKRSLKRPFKRHLNPLVTWVTWTTSPSSEGIIALVERAATGASTIWCLQFIQHVFEERIKFAHQSQIFLLMHRELPFFIQHPLESIKKGDLCCFENTLRKSYLSQRNMGLILNSLRGQIQVL